MQTWTSNTIQTECLPLRLLRIVKSKPLPGSRIALRTINHRYHRMRKFWDSRRLKIVRESPKNSDYMRPSCWKSNERTGIKIRWGQEPLSSTMSSIGAKSIWSRESIGLRMVLMRFKSTDQCQRCNHMLASDRRGPGQTTARSLRRVSRQAVLVIGKSAPYPMSCHLRKRKKGIQ